MVDAERAIESSTPIDRHVEEDAMQSPYLNPNRSLILPGYKILTRYDEEPLVTYFG